MLQLKYITLVQFKNYQQSTFEFESRIVCISGDNGIGKTNLLDTIYYLCFTKSYFSKSDLLNVRTGHQGFRIEGAFQLDGEEQRTVCIFRENSKKEFMVSGNPYDRLSEHIGKFPCVMIAPDDVEVITGHSVERRRFLDTMICQLDPIYLQNLIEYNRVLQQRNFLLRAARQSGRLDVDLIQVYDDQLGQYGSYIYQQRALLLRSLVPLVERLYADITGFEEPINISYRSDVENVDYRELLLHTRQRDVMLERTQAGIHRDEITFLYAGYPFKNIASQGQRKGLLFALKLAEAGLLFQEKGFAPILLLDDAFEKLDSKRMANLLQIVCLQYSGQVFITDTHAQRVREHLAELNVPFQLINLGRPGEVGVTP